MSHDTPVPPRFADLGLAEPVMRAVADVGYETPSPIQAATIPALMQGRDVLGTAQTGTGKTAAFALPLLSRLDLARAAPQVLVLAPTRELAIQVAEAFQTYSAHLPGFRVLPVYGGQAYGPQLAALRRGAHVIVGTPGRVIDHLDRGTLDLSGLSALVLDEADEMLRMGFIDDVEKVLAALPEQRQVALFSATMPTQIRRMAQTYLREPVEVTIAAKTTTSANIRQRYWYVSGLHKLDALTRILEVEPYDAMIVFARTKAATEELAGKLQARGLAAAAINGDMQQAQREKTIQQLKDGKLDILVATDVAARGLDVERISHVLNYDIPYDTESYVHRIGRTGRAGRSGEAILFVTSREKGMLRQIERATRQPIEEMALPSVDAVNDIRVSKFLERIGAALGAEDLEFYRGLVRRFEQEHDAAPIDVAAALARLLQGDEPFLLEAREPAPRLRRERDAAPPARGGDWAPAAPARAPRPPRREPEGDADAARPVRRVDAEPQGGDERHERKPRAPREEAEFGMETFRIDVGHAHGVKPANIVGAIANEAGLESRYIGRIDIHDDYSTVDLPEGMPKELQVHLKKVWVSGQQLNLRRLGEPGEGPSRPFKPRGAHGPRPMGGGPARRKPGGGAPRRGRD